MTSPRDARGFPERFMATIETTRGQRPAERRNPVREQHTNKGASPANSGSSPQQKPQQTMPPRRTWLSFLLILLVNVALARLLFPSATPVKVPYTLFRAQVTAHNVQ